MFLNVVKETIAVPEEAGGNQILLVLGLLIRCCLHYFSRKVPSFVPSVGFAVIYIHVCCSDGASVQDTQLKCTDSEEKSAAC